MFEKEKYYQYIQTLEKAVNFYYVFLMGLGLLIGAFMGIVGVLIGVLIGFFIAHMYTLAIKIKIQDMKWKIDIHTATTNQEP